MNVDEIVLMTLRSVLVGARLDAGSALMGKVPELDSMAVVSILTALEEKFGFSIEDDEIDGHTFASVQSLTLFVRSKLER